MKAENVPFLPGCELCRDYFRVDVDAVVRGYVKPPRRSKPELMDVCGHHWQKYAAIDPITEQTVGRRLRVA